MKGLREFLKNKRTRHIMYIAIGAILVLWVIYRFIAISMDNNLQVFNAARDALENGAPVETITVSRQRHVLYEPIMVKNNRALVSAARVDKFAKGQKIGDGEILSVSHKLDLDTGMYVVRTYGVKDGMGYAEFTSTGFMVPVYAVKNGAVMVVRDGVARRVDVNVLRQDADNAIIASGINAGDVIVVSEINDGAKVKIQK